MDRGDETDESCMRFDEWWSIAVGLVYGFFAFALRRDGSVYLSLRGIRKSLLYSVPDRCNFKETICSVYAVFPANSGSADVERCASISDGGIGFRKRRRRGRGGGLRKEKNG